MNAEEFRAGLRLETLAEFLPAENVRRQVVDDLKRLGFEVFDLASPVVSARGSVALFQSVFERELIRRVRTVTTPFSEHTTISIDLRPGSEPPSASRVAGALIIAVQSRPLFAAPRLPPATCDFNLHSPGDIAQLTRASATHRLCTPFGDRATGGGVAAAVLDTGFARHPYYSDQGYNITRLAAPDTSQPETDADPHGTCILASLLACAPDVDLYGIKIGEDPNLGFALARTLPNLKVISVSSVEVADGTVLSDRQLALQLTILDAITADVTVVAAAGNGQPSTFPAMMREVIAVGGVAVDANDLRSAWSGTSFSSSIFRGRDVPDICGIASTMWLPIPNKPYWISASGGTSCATPQVAGVAALLLQKCPTLSPDNVRNALLNTATDVTEGTTASGHTATVGKDLATGTGLVNAKRAWQSV